MSRLSSRGGTGLPRRSGGLLRRRSSLSAVVSEVARAAGIPVSQLFHWRKQLCGPAREQPGFAAVTVSPSAGSSNMIEVEFANGARLRITGATDGAIVSAMIKAPAKRTGRR